MYAVIVVGDFVAASESKLLGARPLFAISLGLESREQNQKTSCRRQSEACLVLSVWEVLLAEVTLLAGLDLPGMTTALINYLAFAEEERGLSLKVPAQGCWRFHGH